MEVPKLAQIERVDSEEKPHRRFLPRLSPTQRRRNREAGEAALSEVKHQADDFVFDVRQAYDASQPKKRQLTKRRGLWKTQYEQVLRWYALPPGERKPETQEGLCDKLGVDAHTINQWRLEPEWAEDLWRAAIALAG